MKKIIFQGAAVGDVSENNVWTNKTVRLYLSMNNSSSFSILFFIFYHNENEFSTHCSVHNAGSSSKINYSSFFNLLRYNVMMQTCLKF